MSDPQKQKTPPVKNAVRWMKFVSPIDMPGVQESNITCVDEPRDTGVSFTAVYIPERVSVDIRMFRNADPVCTRSVPIAYLVQYEMA